MLAPGDPIDRFRAPRVPPELIDRPDPPLRPGQAAAEQYVAWISTFFTFPWDAEAWGYLHDRPARPRQDLEPLPATVMLMGTARS